MPEFDNTTNAYRVLRRRGEPDVRSLDGYRRAGGYTALEKAIREQSPEQVIQQVIDAKLRGRGGAGRLTGKSGVLYATGTIPRNTSFAMPMMPTLVQWVRVHCSNATLIRLSRVLFSRPMP